MYVSGSDAHGTPILVSSERTGGTPEGVALKYHNEYLSLLERWHINFSNYTITHNPTHIEFCQEFYRKVQKNGYIFKSKSEHPFCPQCKRFLPDRFVEGTCPQCGWLEARGDQCTNPECGRLLTPTELLNPRCVIHGTAPIVKETTHWYFDLPKLQSEIEDFLERSPLITDSARNFSKSLVQKGLKARPITRDLEWGIPADQIFKGAEGKVLYVWAENILGYLSATKELFERRGEGEEWKQLWQCKETKTVFCIGKDNTIFHAIIFPALLIATHDPYVLPHAITATEFITFKGQPFSKSKGIGIGAEEALRVAPVDCWRYFLIIERPETKDLNFTWDKFVNRVNKDLNDVLGNFVHRTLTFTYRQFNHRVPEKGELKREDEDLLKLIRTVAEKQDELIENLKLRSSLETVFSLARAGNIYLSEQKPWHTIKHDKTSAATTLNTAIQVVNALGILIQPYLPSTSEKIRRTLNLPDTIKEQELETIADSPIPIGHPISKPKTLFEKLDKERIKKTLRSRE